MTRIEDEFKKKFKNQELANDDFNSEDLWGAISEDLDKSQSTKIGTNRKFILLFLLFLGIGLIGIYFNNMDIQKIAEQSNVEVKEENQKKISQSKLPSQQSEKLNGPTHAPITDELLLPTKQPANNKVELVPVGELTTNLENTLITLSNNNPVKTQMISDHNRGDYKDNSKLEKTKSYFSSEDSSVNGISTTNSEEEPDISEKAIESLPIDRSTLIKVPSLPLYGLSYVKAHSSYQLNLPSIKNKYNQNNNNNIPISWELSLRGGINSLILNYKTGNLLDLASIKEQSEKMELGMSLGLNATMVLKNRFLLSSGVEYHQLWSKFDYEHTTMTEVLKQNQLIKVWVDKASGDTLSTSYGDIMVDAISTRSVIHYNKYQRYSIPIEFGLQNKTEKLVYGITTGAVLNFTIVQSGKTLNGSKEIVEFGNKSSTATYKPYSIGLRVSPFIGYRVSQNLTLNILPQWNWDYNSKFDGTDLNLNIHQLNLNLGLTYSLE